MATSRFDELERQLGAAIPEGEAARDEDQAALEEVRAAARVYLGLPASASLDVIQAGFAESLWDFWVFFFPHFRQNDQGEETAPAEFHREFCASIQAHFSQPQDAPAQREMARAYPREHAKSVFGSLVGPTWALASELRRFAFLFSDTDTQAWGFLEDIRLECETNERLQAIYPEFCTWEALPRVNRLVFGNGAVAMAAGSGKSVRGARKRHQRPDLIVLDDIENDEEVENPARRRKKMVWYNKVVRKLGRAAVILIVGTILHASSFLAERVRAETDIHAAVVRDADRQDLWQQWEEIFHDRGRADPQADARAFYEAQRVAMDAGAVVLWPERFSLYELYVERAEDLASYLSERQNRPFDPSASWFPEDRIVLLERDDMPSPEQVRFSVFFWDPSRGTSKSDSSALCRLDVLTDGRRIVSQGLADRVPPEEVMDVSIGWFKLRPCQVFGIEKVGLSSYDESLQTRALQAGVALPIQPVTPVGEKNLRIRSMRPLIVSQTLQFSSSLPLEAIRQVKFYPQHQNDDFPDAVQQANRIADEFVADVPAAGGTVEPAAAQYSDGYEDAFGRERDVQRPGGFSIVDRMVTRIRDAWS